MVTESQITEISIKEAASRFIATLPEDEKAKTHQEIQKFVVWYGGWGNPFRGITGERVSKYGEYLALTDADAGSKIVALKAFLNFARKEGWTTENLTIGLKVTKAKGKTAKAPIRKIVREPVPMTQARFDEITAELAGLKDRRIQVTGDIQRAAADKDFKENAPFHAAREQKSLIEGKILELEEILARAVITENSQEVSQAVCIGNTVIIQESGSSMEMRCTLVNPKEVAPSKGKISVASPVGKAALGKREGDKITVAAPAGKREYIIKKIER